MEPSDIVKEVTPSSAETAPIATKKYTNPISIIFIFILLSSLTVWTAVAGITLYENEEEWYPKAIIGLPFIIILCLPPIISLIVILFRSFWTVYNAEDTVIFDPLDLIRNEEQRQLLLLPLSVSGLIMTIVPAYYLHYGKHYEIFVGQAIIGFMLLVLFMGITLVPEGEGTNSRSLQQTLFIPIREK